MFHRRFVEQSDVQTVHGNNRAICMRGLWLPAAI